MRKLWLVAKHEYLKRVIQRSFLFAVLGIPLLMIGVSGISILVALGRSDSRPIGYVDQANLLDPELLPALAADESGFAEIQPYPDEAAARDALEAGQIQAYYLIPATYVETKQLSLTYDEDEPGAGIQNDFETYVRASLVSRQPAQVQDLLSEGLDLTIQSSDGSREMSQGDVVGILLPFVVTFFLFFAIASAGGYLLQAVTDEKENRTVEIITTSISPVQLMGGKALGLMAVSITQILIWVVALVVALSIAARAFEELPPITMPWTLLGLTVLYFVPTFTLIAGMMTTIGAAVTEQQQGQQIAGIINMLFILPIFFVALVFTQPNSPFMVLLTLFPTTAFITILLRWSMASVPLWQMALSWVLLVTTALGSVWLAARVFRMGMLRYGQRLSLKGIIEGLRSQGPALEEGTTSHA